MLEAGIRSILWSASCAWLKDLWRARGSSRSHGEGESACCLGEGLGERAVRADAVRSRSCPDSRHLSS